MGPRAVKFVAAAAALAAFAGAGQLQRPLDAMSLNYGLVQPDDIIAQRHWGVRLLTMAPGGLRAIAINILWMRSEELKQNGQHHEAVQLANLICLLQPHFPGVWAFQEWNLAWNISVQCHTPEERWLWVSKGMTLLRDEGIPRNPRSVILYKELGWLFFSKIAGDMDDMHMAYKRRWAAQMQRLLAAPPLGSADEVIDAFAPIAAAPLDKDPRRQAVDLVQPEQRRLLLKDQALAQYVQLLADRQINLDWSLLDAYNRYSLDEAVQCTRTAPPAIAADRDRAVSDLINSPDYAAPRKAVLAFVRAQLLWNQYRMDPQWMLDLMRFYKAPFDWRIAQTHGLYWVSYGIHVCQSLQLRDIDSINTDRILLSCLKELTWRGRMAYTQNPDDPEMPYIIQWADWRFIRPARDEFDRLAQALKGGVTDKLYETDDVFRAGHVNYMVTAIEMLYSMDRRQDAQEQLDYLKKRYDYHGGEWDDNVEQFVVERLNREGSPISDVAWSQITAALISAHVHLANGDNEGFRRYVWLAHDVMYESYQRNAAQRLQMRPFGEIAAGVVQDLICRPEILGVQFDKDPALDLAVRSRLYRALPPQLQAAMYPAIRRALEGVSRQRGVDMSKAFPAPAVPAPQE